MSGPLASSPSEDAVFHSPSASPLSTSTTQEPQEEVQKKRPSLSVRHAPTASTSSSTKAGSRNSSSGHAQRQSSSGSGHRYKETLDATTRHLEDGSRIINQYRLLEVIGQGAYGVVHRACLVHDPSVEFAIKEFGKTRLRKTHRAANLRRPLGRAVRARARGGVAARGGMGRGGAGDAGGGGEGPNHGQIIPGLSRLNVDDERGPKSADLEPAETDDPLSLIRHEIAILKKLDHPHVVQLFEVLDDPSRDGLYMVFEYCPDGRVIDVKIHEQVEPLKEPVARDYFVQIMLGVEYLHCNDIVHRDIKPDNILLQDNRKTCKIVDFGVSEMFTKPGDDTLQKSAGSPAFMSPELCTAKHGDFHGKSDDVWSLGVTLYCMVVGHLPFDKGQFLELYEAIKSDKPDFPDHLSSSCVDLLEKLLTKVPSKRITIAEMRHHPWITEDGKEEVLSMEDNTQSIVSEVTEEDLDRAICKIASVFTLARAISKFKRAGSRASSAGSVTELAHALTPSQPPSSSSHNKSASTSDSSSPDDPGIKSVAAAHVAAGAQTTAHVLSTASKVIFGSNDDEAQDKSDQSPTDRSQDKSKKGSTDAAGESAKDMPSISESPTGSDDEEGGGGGGGSTLASSIRNKVTSSGGNMLDTKADTETTMATTVDSRSGHSNDSTVDSVKAFVANASENLGLTGGGDGEKKEAARGEDVPQPPLPASELGSGSPITNSAGERKKSNAGGETKVLTQEPTVSSPTEEDIEPPEGASAAYFGQRDEDVGVARRS